MGQLSLGSDVASSDHRTPTSPTPPALPPHLDERRCRRAAQSDCTLLLTGETGVGKGHLALWLHEQSRRQDRPFVPVNCGAIPESLIDSQLFGHTKGAFTGATSEHPGLVRAANGGTLLLDEISELPASAQNRLLRLLQEREIQPVGMSHPMVVDVRVFAATNADLKEAVERKTFREDLLFRLDVIQIPLKPLRERPQETGVLLDEFNREFATLYRQSPLTLEPAARERLLHYAWPGNVRQLRSLIERLHVLSPEKTICVADLIDIGQLADLPRPEDARNEFDQARLDEIRRVIACSGGSVARAAEVFGVHRSTIYRWLSHQA